MSRRAVERGLDSMMCEMMEMPDSAESDSETNRASAADLPDPEGPVTRQGNGSSPLA
jgi:hypothetical protein